MAYSTTADLIFKISEAELIQLTDDVNSGVVDEALLTALRAEVDSLIDEYLKGVAIVPLVTVPASIKGISTDILLHNVYLRRGEVSESIIKQKENALKFLELFRLGKLKVGDISTSAPSGGFSSNNPTKIFDDAKLEGF